MQVRRQALRLEHRPWLVAPTGRGGGRGASRGAAAAAAAASASTGRGARARGQPRARSCLLLLALLLVLAEGDEEFLAAGRRRVDATQPALVRLLAQRLVGQHPHLLRLAAEELPRHLVLRLGLRVLDRVLLLSRLRLRRHPLAVCVVRLAVGALRQVRLQLLTGCLAALWLEAAARARVDQPAAEELLGLSHARAVRHGGLLASGARLSSGARLARLHPPLLLRLDLLAQLVLHARWHVVQHEAERGARLDALLAAARELTVVVLGVVGEGPNAVRAAVAGAHAAELAQAQPAAVQLEALHDEVVVVVLKPRVLRAPLGVAARAEDAGLVAVLVAARNGGGLGLGALVRRLRGRCHLVKGAHELLERPRGAVKVPCQLVGMDHPRELEVGLPLVREGSLRGDRRTEEREHAGRIARFAEREHLLRDVDSESNGIIGIVAPTPGRRRTATSAAAGTAAASLGFHGIDQTTHQLVARLQVERARQTASCESLLQISRLEVGRVDTIELGILTLGVELEAIDEVRLLTSARYARLLAHSL